MKIGIYTPYLDTAGGGEKYMLTIATALMDQHQVEVILDEHLAAMDLEEIKQDLVKLHQLDFSKIKFTKRNLLKRFDYLFYNCDGSIFYSHSKNSILHFQTPLDRVEVSGFWNKLKLRTWKLAIYNSEFTREDIEKKLKIPGRVIYPPVDVKRFKQNVRKEKIILSVGRLTGTGAKKQDMLIETFIGLIGTQGDALRGWRLVLVGGTGEGDQGFVDSLKKMAQDYPIEVIPNLEFDALTKLYEKSIIYWHAAGFGEDNPKDYEHFGMTTVEAMAAGCVPVVINKGGQTEIVNDGENGYLWNTQSQLIQKTLKLIKDARLVKQLSSAAVLKSANFSEEKFIRSIMEVVK